MRFEENGSWEKSAAFCEQKVAKKRCPAGCGETIARARRTKSFLLIFFKKEALPCLFSNYMGQPRRIHDTGR